MDMSPAYHDAVSTYLPKATIVYDHFHVIKLFNDKLSDLRRSLYHKAEDEQKKVLKGSRWLLLKAAENLDPERDEEARLEKALELNKPLATAYYMKEDLRQFWSQSGKTFAGAFLTDWIRRAEASGVRMLQQMAKTLESRRLGLLAYYDYPISTGPFGGDEQQDQDDEAAGVRVPGPGVLQTEDPGDPRGQVRFSRMNQYYRRQIAGIPGIRTSFTKYRRRRKMQENKAFQ
jgi:hypothetical protein